MFVVREDNQKEIIEDDKYGKKKLNAIEIKEEIKPVV